MSFVSSAGRPAFVNRMASFPATSPRNLFLLLGAIFAAAGCGSSAGGAGAKAADARAESPKEEEADPAAALDRAEREIAMLFGQETQITSAPTATAVPAEPTYAGPPPVAPAQKPPTSAEALSGKTGGDAPAGDPCAVACRALASMERAANHLCGLSGEEQDPCTSARERVKNANARVAARCACTP